ncbi:cytochrome P450 [Shouchella patagoniensis]|uniref:cytochrome P450 n=1 Tax=Shouchella patagoniensis TaxID=228576 RepID=UPI0009951856|nr:cytochrome P450 [Shouchella patagoniensis]
MSESQSIPKEEGKDHTLDVLREGYLFISNRAQGFQSDLFQSKLLGEDAICLRGAEAAELFYDQDKFTREGAAPKRVLKTLFGEGGVQTLDGELHHHRKALFMSLMTKDALKEIRAITDKQWKLALSRWDEQDEIILYEEAQKLLCRTACEWAGVPLSDKEVSEKSDWLASMIEATAAIGPHHWKGRRARTKTEKWIQGLVKEVREGEIVPDEHTALYQMSWHRELNGELMDVEVAAVEIINIIRPIVAVAIYICFTALAVHQQSDQLEKLKESDETRLQHFIQEVRRFYPFFPFTAARTAKDFEWKGYSFKKGTLTLLDLYGTNHHPDLWDNPEQFNPERFETWKKSPFDFIPQGGGDYDVGHRCAGEWLTVEILKESLDYLANKMSYTIPDQDLSFSFNEIPSLPHSHIVMQDIRLK